MGKGKYHDDKNLNQVIEQAIDVGWSFERARGGGHAKGLLKCPHYDSGRSCRGGQYCKMTINGSPKNATTEAKKIRQKVERCRPPERDNQDEDES